MAIDTNALIGEVIQDPEGKHKDVEQLLAGLLKALLAEQEGGK